MIHYIVSHFGFSIWIESNVIFFNSVFMTHKTMVTSHIFSSQRMQRTVKKPCKISDDNTIQLHRYHCSSKRGGRISSWFKFAEFCHFNLAGKCPYVVFVFVSFFSLWNSQSHSKPALVSTLKEPRGVTRPCQENPVVDKRRHRTAMYWFS